MNKRHVFLTENIGINERNSNYETLIFEVSLNSEWLNFLWVRFQIIVIKLMINRMFRWFKISIRWLCPSNMFENKRTSSNALLTPINSNNIICWDIPGITLRPKGNLCHSYKLKCCVDTAFELNFIRKRSLLYKIQFAQISRCQLARRVGATILFRRSSRGVNSRFIRGFIFKIFQFILNISK